MFSLKCPNLNLVLMGISDVLVSNQKNLNKTMTRVTKSFVTPDLRHVPNSIN